MLGCNYHTHTVMCDGSDTPEDVVLEAIAKGFEHLGFSGHMDPDIHMDWPAYVAEIRRLRSAYASKIDILLGVEARQRLRPRVLPGRGVRHRLHALLDVDSEVPLSVDASVQGVRRLCHEFFADDYYALARAYYEPRPRGCTIAFGARGSATSTW